MGRTVGDIAREISDRDGADIFLYNGDIERGADLDIIQGIHEHQERDTCKLLLVTPGGDPNAAYKISRYLQERYRRFECLISGYCKSAGTLLAMGANQLVFLPYGELGPLDIQVAKEDKITGLHSGLNISEALQALEQRAVRSYLSLIGDILKSSSGVVSFPTASKAASEVVTGLYGPIFGKIDPEDVGSRTRSMRIAADYGKRLNVIAQNMKPGAVRKLAETYASHSFVIDKVEASALFNNVRDADPLELELVDALGRHARWVVGTQNDDPMFVCLSRRDDEEEEDSEDENATVSDEAEPGSDGPDGTDREDSSRAGESPSPKPSRSRRTNGGRPAKADI